MSDLSPKEIRDLVQTKLALRCPSCGGALAARCLFDTWTETAARPVHLLPIFVGNSGGFSHNCALCGEGLNLDWPAGSCGRCVLVIAEEAEEEFRNEVAEGVYRISDEVSQ